MIATIDYKGQHIQIDLSKPIDISIPIDMSKQQINAWYLDAPKIFPEEHNGHKIKVSEGASVNFNSIHFNPHSHITHTECVGHITQKIYSVNKHLKRFFFKAQLISVLPEKVKDDFVITKAQLESFLSLQNDIEAIVIRTLPNDVSKLVRQYSNTNPPYLEEAAVIYLKEKGIQHLLIDLPSVDKEKDNGKLLSHNAFWRNAQKLRFEATITEFIYVPNEIADGTYFLNLMIAPFENDASPSKPILYKIIE